MERIIDGVRYESKLLPDTWDVRVFEVNGHRETSARQASAWFESENQNPYAREGDGYQGAATAAQLAKWAAQDAAELEEKHQNSLKKSAARAMTTCRRVIKAEGFNELLTLTYRANQANRELCKKHFKEWVRRMKVALGDFRYCASFETQDRGAMHVHVATHKLPQHADYKGVKIKAWEVGTRIWRDVIGDYPFEGPLYIGASWPKVDNGLCFVGGKPKFADARRRNMSIGKMASYVSKYILKDFEKSPSEKNRYSRSNGTVLPKPKHYRFDNTAFVDLIGLIFELGEGDCVLSHRVGIMGDSYWLVTEPDSNASRPQRYT